MTALTQKYCIIQLLEPKEEGAEWRASEWPLHVTIADVFAVDWAGNDLFTRLGDLLAEHQPFTSTAQGDEQFGEQGQVHVTLLDMNKELITLHRDAVALLKNAGAVFNTPQYIEEGFRAHATVRPHSRLHTGDTVTFRALAVVDMFPEDDPQKRKILKIIRLG